MSRFVLRPFEQQHAIPEQIVGFASGLFYTASGKKLMVISRDKIRRVG